MGRVGRPHGKDGTFHVSEPSQRAGVLEAGRSVRVGDRMLVITERGGTGTRPLLKLEGIEARADAEALRGSPITVSRADLGPVPEDEHLVDDLIDCEVRDGRRLVGRVKDVVFLPSVDALEVERPNGQTVLIPLVSDAVRAIDTECSAIDVNLEFLQLADGTG